MKEEINRFNSENGNVTYSVKELLAGLHTKVDDHIIAEEQRNKDFREDITKNYNHISNINTSLKWHKMLIISLYSMISIAIFKPLKLFFGKFF